MLHDLTIVGLIFNFIGTILLSIPTVDGIKYLSFIIEYIKKPLFIVVQIFIGLFILWYILHFIGIDILFITLFMDIKEDISFWELATIIYQPVKFLLPPIIIIFILIKFLEWLQADREHQREKEKRAGAIGILLILLGFMIQIFEEISKY